jgi:hypothetical protein
MQRIDFLFNFVVALLTRSIRNKVAWHNCKVSSRIIYHTIVENLPLTPLPLLIPLPIPPVSFPKTLSFLVFETIKKFERYNIHQTSTCSGADRLDRHGSRIIVLWRWKSPRSKSWWQNYRSYIHLRNSTISLAKLSWTHGFDLWPEISCLLLLQQEVRH